MFSVEKLSIILKKHRGTNLDKQKLREVINTRPTLQEMLKVVQAKMKRC